MVFSADIPIKQVACTRRKPNLTHQEFLDYHFQRHGALADEPEERDLKPSRYTQTHIFDAAFGGRSDGLPNANHAWVGRDDITELFFRNVAHLKTCMFSDFVKERIGPDAAHFADFEVAISVMANEKTVKTIEEVEVADQQEFASLLFLSPADNDPDGTELEKTVSPELLAALEKHASGKVRAVLANVGVEIPGLDPRQYFGGKDMPVFSLVYKVYLGGSRDDTTMIRAAEAALQKSVPDRVNWNNSFVVFGYEALILDHEKSVRFDPKRQPRLF
ncbi:hypothetical protein Plec18170_000607 [Paecilomyces lecythidis]